MQNSLWGKCPPPLSSLTYTQHVALHVCSVCVTCGEVEQKDLMDAVEYASTSEVLRRYLDLVRLQLRLSIKSDSSYGCFHLWCMLHSLMLSVCDVRVCDVCVM